MNRHFRTPPSPRPSSPVVATSRRRFVVSPFRLFAPSRSVLVRPSTSEAREFVARFELSRVAVVLTRRRRPRPSRRVARRSRVRSRDMGFAFAFYGLFCRTRRHRSPICHSIIPSVDRSTRSRDRRSFVVRSSEFSMGFIHVRVRHMTSYWETYFVDLASLQVDVVRFPNATSHSSSSRDGERDEGE